MITIRVLFANGDSFVTGINCSYLDAYAYYVGKVFNLGTGGEDKLVECLHIQLLDN